MLCLALLLAALPVILPVFTSATAADDQEEQLLGTLSQRFEASGPGVVPVLQPQRHSPGLLPVVSVLLRYILPLHRQPAGRRL